MTPEPGRHLDALVAEKVMGWIYVQEHGTNKTEFLPPSGEVHHIDKMPPFYSTGISAAWQVVEKLRKDDFTLNLDDFGTGHGWHCSFSHRSTINHDYSWSESAPHAICLAALKAVGYEEKANND